MNRFIFFPAIDLKDGNAVRLREGDMASATIFATNPADQARVFAQAGAQWLHLVDLNGAFAGKNINATVVRDIIAAFPGRIQLGGGIRDMATLDMWCSAGVERIVLGTAALKNPELVRVAAQKYPRRIVVAVDARDGFVATQGWADISTVSVIEMAKRFEDAGVAALLFTDIGRDGLLKGVNIEATIALAQNTSLDVIASGGVADIRDIELLLQARATTPNISGVIAGRAIYDNRLDVKAALALC
jgi:phosphoribosylformimino-5-aminoimidazole carboxamide ribotide isomerase